MLMHSKGGSRGGRCVLLSGKDGHQRKRSKRVAPSRRGERKRGKRRSHQRRPLTQRQRYLVREKIRGKRYERGMNDYLRGSGEPHAEKKNPARGGIEHAARVREGNQKILSQSVVKEARR